MSVEGCYTDFHIDFGGTSVWYHILRGSKVGPQPQKTMTHYVIDEFSVFMLLPGAQSSVCITTSCGFRCSG